MTVGSTSFPKTSRLRLANDFREILKHGKCFRENGFAIHVLKSNRKESRLGIVVAKNIFKRAIDRNRAKRLIREFFRREKNILSSCDIVVRVVDNHNALNTNNLRICLTLLFKKAVSS